MTAIGNLNCHAISSRLNNGGNWRWGWIALAIGSGIAVGMCYVLCSEAPLTTSPKSSSEARDKWKKPLDVGCYRSHMFYWRGSTSRSPQTAPERREYRFHVRQSNSTAV
jgi:hypothetical protein